MESIAVKKTAVLETINRGRSPVAAIGGSLSKDGIGRLQHHNLLLLRATTGGALIPTFNYLRDATLRTPRSQQLSSMEVITDTSRNVGMKNGVLIAPTILGTTKD